MPVQSITGFRTNYCTTRERVKLDDIFYASILVQVVFDLNIKSHHTYFFLHLYLKTYTWHGHIILIIVEHPRLRPQLKAAKKMGKNPGAETCLVSSV